MQPHFPTTIDAFPTSDHTGPIVPSCAFEIHRHISIDVSALQKYKIKDTM